MSTLEGLSPTVIESLTLMAARSQTPADLADAAAGFDAATARHMSELHTPNLM